MKCLLFESVNVSDDQITRGEILCICRIMTSCLRLRAYRPHHIIPVSACIHSFFFLFISTN